TVQADSFRLPSASITSGFVLGSVVYGLPLPVKLLSARLIGKAKRGSPTRSIKLDLELPDGLQGPPLVAFPHPQGESRYFGWGREGRTVEPLRAHDAN